MFSLSGALYMVMPFIAEYAWSQTGGDFLGVEVGVQWGVNSYKGFHVSTTPSGKNECTNCMLLLLPLDLIGIKFYLKG